MNQIQQKQYTGKGGIYQQLTLLISENILIDEHEPVYVATAQLEELDYRKRYQAYSSKGRKSAAEPRIMVKLLVYGYMCGIYSTRKLELACCKNIDFISRGSLLQPQNALHEGPERVDVHVVYWFFFLSAQWKGLEQGGGAQRRKQSAQWAVA